MKQKLRKIRTSVIALMVSVLTMTSLFTIPVYAQLVAGNSAYDTLVLTVQSGTYDCITTGKQYDFQSNRYKLEDGGYVLYVELMNNVVNNANAAIGTQAGSNSQDIFLPKFEELKQSSKKKFLSDVFTLVNAVIYDGEHGNLGTIANELQPTSDTGIDFMNTVAQQTGMASTMLSTILQNTTPDYLTANRIYAPFSGVIGTILGLLSVLIMAFLGVTMGLDIAYITIPAVQMAFGGDENGGGGQDGKGGFKAGGLISAEAKAAVKAADGGGGQGGSGEYKAAVGIYFKYRWKGLVLLAVCLLYLVQGEIYSLIGWFLDLFGGFLGQ